MNLPSDIFQSLHVLLISEDDTRGKALAKALRDQRARVGEIQRSSRDTGASRGADLVVVDARVQRSSADQLASLKSDIRARWASVVTVDFESVVKSDGSVHLGSLSEIVAPLVQSDRKLTERAREENTFKTSLAPLGPSRALRALSLSGHTLLVELKHPGLDATLEVSNELLVSASASRSGKRWEAWSALVRILGLDDAEISVSRRAFSTAMNIMEPVDQALEVAAQERLCAAEQIAVEEAEALAKHKPAAAKLPPPPPPAALPPAKIVSPSGATFPPARPAASLGPQRTLLGMMTPLGAPAAGGLSAAASAAPAANADPEAKPTLPVPEPPRYAHRPGQAPGAKANMTLMGVSPGAIPGLAEARSQMAQTRPAEPSPLTKVSIQRKPDNSDFDPPTVRHNVAELAAELPDLDDDDDLPNLLDDLSASASPLSTPLPPARPTDEETEPHPGSLNDTFEDAEDPEDQTTVAPSALTRELLEQAVQDALAERPSLETGGARPIQAMRQGPHNRELSVELVGEVPKPIVQEIEAEGETASEGAPEETLVVKRPPEKRASKSRVMVGLCILLGLASLLLYAQLREREASQAREREASQARATAPSAPAQPAAPAAEPPAVVAPSEPAPAEPKPADVAPSAVAEPTLAEPSAVAPSEPAPSEPAPVPAPEAKAAAAAPAPSAAPTPPAAAAPVVPATPAPAAPSAPAAGPAPAAEEPAATGEDSATLLRKGQRLLQSDPAGARAALEQALAQAQDNPHIREALAQATLKQGDFAAAQTQAQAAIKLRPKRSRYQVLLGDVLKAQGKAEEAQAAYQKALEIDANDAEAKQRLGVKGSAPSSAPTSAPAEP